MIMKSRRHRAIDKSKKQKPMASFKHSKKDKKWIAKEFKKTSRKFFDDMKELHKIKWG